MESYKDFPLKNLVFIFLKIFLYYIFHNLVPAVGIEPTWIAPHDFESCAYTSSATRARLNQLPAYVNNMFTSAFRDSSSPLKSFGFRGPLFTKIFSPILHQQLDNYRPLVAFGQEIRYDRYMINEPTIHKLEELLAAFREQGGSDAEISALARDIIRDFRPEVVRPANEVFEREQHASIRKITDFKKDPANPIHEAWHKFWHYWYVKYPVAFIVLFFAIFATSNLPLYFTKLAPTKTVTKEVITNKVLVKSETAKSAPLEPGEVVPTTATLVVPKLGVTAPILFVDTYDEATIEANLRNGVVHYYQTTVPGKVGNSFITGHSSNYWWDKGAYNYIFANLDKLAVGDQTKIYYEGNKFLYQVSAVKVVEPTDLSVLDQTSKPTLTLMTCTPPGTSWKRLIVSFDQISPIYKAPTIMEKDAVTSSKTPSQLPKSDSSAILDWIARLFNL